VGAGVAGAQAETTSTVIAITARNRCSDFFMFFSSYKVWILGKFPEIQTFERGEENEEVTASVSCCDDNPRAGDLCLRACHCSTY
jgi:hypothetical protein